MTRMEPAQISRPGGTRRLLAAAVVLGAMTLIVGTGCKKEKGEPEYREVEGKVTAINENTGEVTVRWYNKKKQEYMEHAGTLDRDAEILINGRTASLGDVRIDDRVTITVLLESSGGNERLIAKRVQVERPEFPSTSTQSSAPEAPASQ